MSYFSINIPENMSSNGGYITVTRMSENGISSGTVTMTMEGLIRSLNNGVELREISSSEEIAPLPLRTYFPGCISHQWINYNHDSGESEEVVITEVPKAKWDTFFHHQPFINVGFPRLIIVWKIRNSQIYDMEIYAAKDDQKPVDEQTDLYRFPYPNVYDNGRVCLGTINLPKLEQFSDLKDMHKTYLSLPFSADLFNTRGINQKYKEAIDIFKAYENVDFNDDELVRKYKNLGHVMNSQSNKK